MSDIPFSQGMHQPFSQTRKRRAPEPAGPPTISGEVINKVEGKWLIRQLPGFGPAKAPIPSAPRTVYDVRVAVGAGHFHQMCPKGTEWKSLGPMFQTDPDCCPVHQHSRGIGLVTGAPKENHIVLHSHAIITVEEAAAQLRTTEERIMDSFRSAPTDSDDD